MVKTRYLVKMKGHFPNFNNNITGKPSCAEPVILKFMIGQKQTGEKNKHTAHAHTCKGSSTLVK